MNDQRSMMPGELPPVEPPSARFIMQLFVIPFIVVVLLVSLLSLVYVMFGRLASGGQDAVDYVRAIRSGNENRRWRAAFELASLIHNDAKLASDPVLLGELSALLDEELAKPPGQAKVEVTQYLATALGAFQTLEAKSSSGKGDPVSTLIRALGESQPEEVRIASAQSLSRQIARLDGKLDDPRVVEALIQASRSEEAGVRQNAVYPLGYFQDEASGAALRERLTDGERDVRYNAAVALARRGDSEANPVLREMLSPPDLAQVFERELRESPGEANRKIEAVELEALLALKAAVEAGRLKLALALRPDLVRLSQTADSAVQVEAKSLLKELPEAP